MGADSFSLIGLFKQITNSKCNVLLKQFIYSTEHVLVDLHLNFFTVQHLSLNIAILPHSLHILAHHRHRLLHVSIPLPLHAHEQWVMHRRLLVGIVHHAHRRPVLRHERQRHLRISRTSRAHVKVLRQQHHHMREVAQRRIGLTLLRLGDLPGSYGEGETPRLLRSTISGSRMPLMDHSAPLRCSGNRNDTIASRRVRRACRHCWISASFSLVLIRAHYGYCSASLSASFPRATSS